MSKNQIEYRTTLWDIAHTCIVICCVYVLGAAALWILRQPISVESVTGTAFSCAAWLSFQNHVRATRVLREMKEQEPKP